MQQGNVMMMMMDDVIQAKAGRQMDANSRATAEKEYGVARVMWSKMLAGSFLKTRIAMTTRIAMERKLLVCAAAVDTHHCGIG